MILLKNVISSNAAVKSIWGTQNQINADFNRTKPKNLLRKKLTWRLSLCLPKTWRIHENENNTKTRRNAFTKMSTNHTALSNRWCPRHQLEVPIKPLYSRFSRYFWLLPSHFLVFLIIPEAKRSEKFEFTKWLALLLNLLIIKLR